MRQCPSIRHGISADFSLWIGVRIIQCGVCTLSLMLESKLDCFLFRRVWFGLLHTSEVITGKSQTEAYQRSQYIKAVV